MSGEHDKELIKLKFKVFTELNNDNFTRWLSSYYDIMIPKVNLKDLTEIKKAYSGLKEMEVKA